MKIILSRKGFDSSYGGIPSPIVPSDDGSVSLHSLPIPSPHATCEYKDVRWQGGNLQELILSLRHGRRPMPQRPHLDPDLDREAMKDRHPNWRPIFGHHDQIQVGNWIERIVREGQHTQVKKAF